MSAFNERFRSDDDGALSRLRRLFGGSDDPLRWSLPLFRFAGISVRLHVFFLIFIIARLVASLPGDSLGPGYTALGLGALFLIVLLHEFGHCFACRYVGGEAEEILMWPLGGLAYCSPPNRPAAHLVTVVGGPAVNVVLLVLFAPLLYVFTGAWQAALPNLLAPGESFALMSAAGGGVWLTALWWLNVTNLILLLFNLVPMFPLDGGRIVQALVWMRTDYRRSMTLAVNTGFAAAIVLAVLALVIKSENDIMLLGVAIFGGIVCYLEKRRLQFAEEELGFAGYDFSRGYAGLEDEDDEHHVRAERRAEKEHERRERESAEIDRILAKVSATGMDSLSYQERRVLKRATKRRQGR